MSRPTTFRKPYQKPTLIEHGQRLDLTMFSGPPIEPKHRIGTSLDGTAASNSRVLLVDDDRLLLQMLKDSLRESGFEVATAGDGNEALRVIPEFKPDVIVMDVMMPGENGYRVSRAIKQLGSEGMDAPPKIVLLTGRRVDEDSEREAMFLQFSQADAMLYKPCNSAQLLETIVRLLAASC